MIGSSDNRVLRVSKIRSKFHYIVIPKQPLIKDSSNGKTLEQYLYNNDKDKKKKEPGKRCVGMFFNTTNSDGVNMHQFPTDEISSTVDFF